MSSPQNTKKEQGSALVIAVIVLALLTALGFAALNVADLNINIAANDRDAKDAFFYADSGVNVGHEFLETSLYDRNSSFYDGNETLELYIEDSMQTDVWANATSAADSLEGESLQMAAGYEADGKIGASREFVITSHRIGTRNSRATVEIGWRHIVK